MIRYIAFALHIVLNKVPNFITDRISPLGMPRAYKKISKKNPYNIKTTLTNQSICALHCGKCKTNPFTHGGLYCLSGKSKKTATEKGCECKTCPLYFECGGGQYYCLYGSAVELEQRKNPPKDEIKEISPAPAVNANSSYTQRFIDILKRADQEKQLRDSTSKSPDTKPTSNTSTNTITYIGRGHSEGLQINVKDGATILEAFKENGIPHISECGGYARCSTCRVSVEDGLNHLSLPNQAENDLKLKKVLPNHVRLACQSQVHGDVKLRGLIYEKEDIKMALSEGINTSSAISLEKDVTVLFSDIRGFTSFSENYLSYDVVHVLNRYFGDIGQIIDKNNGYIDKYMGDGIMAVFGFDNNDKEGAKSAIKTGLEIIDNLNSFNIYLANNFNHKFEIGIGIHHGKAILGNIGFYRRRDFTAIGDTVNTASRIEAATVASEYQILISESCYELVKGDFNWSPPLDISVKGKSNEIKVYSPYKKIIN